MRILIIIIFFSIISSSFADVYCASCKKKISGRYLLDSKKRPFCSKTCFSSTLPSCSVCRNKISGTYKKSKDKIFCSSKCLATILPKCSLCQAASSKVFKIDDARYCEPCNNKPHCFTCSHPFVEGVRHSDGRTFCMPCRKAGIFNEAVAAKVYKEAQAEHVKLTGRKGKKIPPLKFVNMAEMKKHHPIKNGGTMTLRGYYEEVKKESTTMRGNTVVNKVVSKVGENIFLINGLKKEGTMVTALHELTHDWLSDYYPGIKVAPLWVEEGACQYLAYIYSKKNKLKKSAFSILTAKDNVYGKGFKFYLGKFGEDNWVGALKWMKSQGYLKAPVFGTKRKQ